MPTARGWICFLFGLVFVVAGRVFGLVEMYIVGGILIALIALSMVIAIMRPLRLSVGRTLTPPRLHVGATARVELAVRNGSTRSPVLRMTDHVEGTSGAQLLISPLAKDEVARAGYRLPTERRGLVNLGPVRFEANDPFGLTLRRFSAASTGQLVVYPEVIPIAPAPPSPATDRRSNSDVPEFLGGRSEEFHALRNYVPGDDIRRINWAASARHDELIVREDEAPTQNHLTVIFDNAAMNSVAAVDKCASIAASLLSSMRDRPDPFRLITVDGQDTGFLTGQGGVEKALSLLAITEEVRGDRSEAIVPRDAQGAVVVVTTRDVTVERSELTRYGRVMYLAALESVWNPDAPAARSHSEAQLGEIQLTLGSMDELAEVWARSIATLLSARR